MPLKWFQNIDTIFFDFDGVIKDSVEVKTGAYEQLFASFGGDVVKKIRRHHEINGGMSRFNKLPIYLKWSGQDPTQELIKDYTLRFSTMVKHKVIKSQWVPGVLEYLEENYGKCPFFLVTATPQSEIEEILSLINIKHFFTKVIGSPTTKDEAIKMLLNEFSLIPESSIMIGDSFSDFNAAKTNGVPFVLRRTNMNRTVQNQLDCPRIENFL